MKKKRSQVAAQRFGKLVFGFLCFVLILNVVMPDKELSTRENRPLQQFPEWSNEALLDGQYTKNIDTWFSDQFVGRNFAVYVKYLVAKLAGNKDINDVFLTKQGLMEGTYEVNEEQLKRNIDAINAYCQSKQVRSGILLAPNAVSVQKEELPNHADVKDQDPIINSILSSLDPSISKIDVRSILKDHKDEYLYYKSDHHWTTDAAYYAFTELAKSFELGDINKDQYDIYPVHDDFKGTLAKKTGSVGIHDTISIYVGKNDPDYVMTIEDTGTKTRSVYSKDSLHSANPYDVFLQGNHGQVQIETTSESGRHLLLFKDSYANSLIPFLLPYYRTITVIDPRYYYEDLSRVFDVNLITDVLFVYNANTFVQDTSIADLLEGTV